MDHLEPLRRRIRAAPTSDPPTPWKRLAVHAVGGLTDVGFADDSDMLLIVSSEGRGVVYCRTGERVARDREEPDDSWYDERKLFAKGIGPLESKTIRLAGLNGGGFDGFSHQWSSREEVGNWATMLRQRDGLAEQDAPPDRVGE